MNQLTRSIVAPIAVLTGFHLLFWRQWLGVNSFLFTLLAFVALYIVRPESRSSKVVWIATAGALLSSAMIVYHNTLSSKWIGILMYMTAVGFWLQPRLYFTGYALLTYLTDILVEIPLHIFKSLVSMGQRPEKQGRKVTLAYVFIPLLALIVFWSIYLSANPEFVYVTNTVSARVLRFFEDLDWSWIGFMFIGIVFSSILFWQTPTHRWLAKQGSKSLALVRKRTAKMFPRHLHTGLYHEYRIALLTLGTLNALLFVVNLTDLRYVWLHFDRFKAGNLTEYVHEGTYTLIVSILMAMGVALYFFRNNLNFFSQNQKLLLMTYAWIAQNAFLALSVGMRNYRYIAHFGLAYKRVGLIFFLILTLFGLFTLFLKIKDKRSSFFLFVANSWAIFTLSMFSVCINWDIVITKYNLFTPIVERLDTDFLIQDMSYQNTALLVQHKDLLIQKGQREWITAETIEHQIEEKAQNFLQSMEKKQDWQSWSYTYSQQYQTLKQHAISSNSLSTPVYTHRK